MDVKTKGSQTSVHFDSLTEYMESYPKGKNERTFTYYRNRHGNDGWLSIRKRDKLNAKEIVDKALLGWNEAFTIAEKLSGRLDLFEEQNYVQQQKVIKRKIIHTDFGDELDIHKVLQGRVDTAWRKTKRIEDDVKHHLTTLMIDVGGNAGVKVHDSLWRAAVAYKIADKLIRAGKSVKIIIGSSCNHLVMGSMSRVVTTDIVVKQYNEPLSMERLAAMSNVAFHRVFNFSARCFIPERISSSMGSSIQSLGNRPPIQMEDEIEKGHTRYIYIPRCTTEYDANRAIKKINETMKEFSMGLK